MSSRQQQRSLSRRYHKQAVSMAKLYEQQLLLREAEFEDPLMRIFVQPFTDIFDVARAGVEKIAATAWTHLGSLVKQAVVLAVPFLSTSTMDSIQKNAEEKVEQKLASVDAKYGPVMSRVYEGLKNRDLWGTAFLFNPSLYLGFKVATLGPQAALSALEAITGGNATIKAMKEKLSLLNQRKSYNVDTSGDWSWGDYDIGGYGGMFEQYHAPSFHHLKTKSLTEIYFFNEQNQQQQAQQPRQQGPRPSQKEIDAYLMKQIQAAMKRNDVQQAMQNNPVARGMRELGVESVMETANEIASLKTYDQLKNYFGDDFTKFEKELYKTVGQPQSPEQEEAFKKEFATQLRAKVLEMYSKQVIAMSKKFPGAGPQLQKIAQKIASM